MPETTPFLYELPADHYGVHVVNDLAARQFRYLVDQVGGREDLRQRLQVLQALSQ